MNCCCGSLGKTLHYVSPAHGGWGVVRIAALVPESYQLFVAPFACGRHGALGGILNGIKDRISYLFIDESDIVSGGYEDLIPEAVEELLASLEKRPKVLMIFVSCLDDLLGTDHVSLNQILSERFPGIKFLSCHMNPISLDTDFPPGVTLQNNIYSLLEKSDKKDRAINLIGNNASLKEDCELFALMNNEGIKVKHIGDCATFHDFEEMSKSLVNVILSPVAKHAAKNMEQSLAIPALRAYTTYSLSEISEFYKLLGEYLGVKLDYQSYYDQAENSLKLAHSLIGDMPIAIDYQAVRKPFTLAKTLLEYGFNVRLIMIDSVKALEKEVYDFIIKNYPEVEIVNALHHEMAHIPIRQEEYLCIGIDCAYATKAKKVVNIMEDEALFGFFGISELMRMIVEANGQDSDLKEMIEGAKLII